MRVRCERLHSHMAVRTLDAAKSSEPHFLQLFQYGLKLILAALLDTFLEKAAALR